MPIHDWTRVASGTFHDFHCAWITHIKETLNENLLPAGYYALAEQHFKQMIGDVLTLHLGDAGESQPVSFSEPGPLAVAVAPPRVSRKMVAEPYEVLRKTVAVRRSIDHRVVAIIEIVSPGNKDRRNAVDVFTRKVWSALDVGVHVLVIDLFPPTKSDPNGIHGEIWKACEPEEYLLPANQPLTLASYVSNGSTNAYIEHAAVGDILVDMPLFLDRDWYINVPLEVTYQAAWRGVPSVFRDQLKSLK